jgi:hypothetical protein
MSIKRLFTVFKMTIVLDERAMMKIVRTMHVVMAVLLAGSMQVNAQKLQLESSAQLMQKKMQEITESQKRHKNILLVDQSDVEVRQRDELVQQTALAAGSVTALVMLYKIFMENPQNFGDVFWGSVKLFFGVGIVGSLLSSVYRPVIKFLVTSMYLLMGNPIIEQQKFLHKEVMIEFIKNWHEFKPHMPILLHQQLDDLYLLYLQQGSALILTDEQAAYLINGIIMNCIQEHLRVLNQEGVQAS